nr:RNA-directed DNA polymerase, eukaryota, reverse transcriptase zinc-binding domain protein [Tanacetum cinerariifolium]
QKLYITNPEDIDNQESRNHDNCLNDSGLDKDSDMEEVPETCFEDGKSMNKVIAKQNSLKNKERGNKPMASGHFKQSECPRTGGLILSLLEEVVKVGQVMGYRMEGCMANMG